MFPFHKNTLENDGSPEGLCSGEGDVWSWTVRMEKGRELNTSYDMVVGIIIVWQEQNNEPNFVVVSRKVEKKTYE